MTGQLTLPVSEKRLESPEGLMQAALAWIDANPDAWDRIVAGAQRDSLDNVPVRLKWYVESLRATVTPGSNDYRIPNALTAALARVLKAWHPEVAAYVRTSPSKLDGIVIPPRPYR